jgi:hypothetical protein
MDAEERDICDFLKSWPDQYVGGREIAKRAGGKWRFRDDPNWANPVLSRLVDAQIVEADASGHYRLLPEKKNKHLKKWWLSPDKKKALEESGKQFDGVVTDIPDEES